VAALNGEGARVIEEAGAGFVGPAESPECLAKAVLSLYRLSPASRARMGHSAQEYFLKHFDREKLLDSLIAWMYDLVEKRPLREDDPPMKQSCSDGKLLVNEP
jgi:colanic acid biosynthesis glycosyl transferase WcaI